MFLIELVLLFGLFFGLAYVRASRLVWTPVFFVLLFLMSWIPEFHGFILLAAWLIFIVVGVFANANLCRRHFITRFLINAARRVLPPISQTEREALEAGTVWWEGDLFSGKPNWKKLHAMPKPGLSQEEQAFIDKQTQRLCEMIDDWQVIHDRDMNKETWDFIKREKFFGMLIPKQYGGLGFSALAQSTVVSKIAAKSISAAVSVMVPNSLGPAELLLHYGTDEQKNYYLPRLATAEEIPCFALTSEEAGSDAGAMLDRGVVCKGMHEGKEMLGIRLNWSKRYITLCPIATVLGLAFKLFDPEHLLGDKEALGITCALIPTKHPGVETGKRHLPMYLAFMNGPTRGKDVFIPLDWIIGGPDMAGKGWRMLMECLSVGRAISLPALSTAGGKRSFRMTGAYARLRQQFRVPIGKFEGVAEAMADIAGKTYLLEATRLMTAGALGLDAKPAIASAIAKYHMTEMCRDVINHAMDIHSGKGIQTGPSNYLANGYISLPIAITVEGANILTRNLMIFGQGSVRCHPYLYHELEALMDEDKARGLKQFDKYLIKHIGYAVSNLSRSLLMGLSEAAWVRVPTQGALAKYYRQLTRMSSALALVSDMAFLILGGELKRKESLSARLGDVLSHLYMATAAIKFYRDSGQPKEDLPALTWCLKRALYEIQEAFYGVFENFPKAGVGGFLRLMVFPYGRAYKQPSFDLSHKLAQIMMDKGGFRDRLTQHCYVGHDSTTPSGKIEVAFEALIKVEPLLKRLNQALKDKVFGRDDTFDERVVKAKAAGLINEPEAKQLLDYDALLFDAMRVDEFNHEELSWQHNVSSNAES
ncbi:MAG: acyl-CoA dehydrogenase [Gammaproteobacteria bacterium CG11_big_fil_rev_8_21_14_0_20_46_22]|nr:MAG: acyl-CoA dehydrogenase [Gammaproteobacteria bacterium CG12_big_fil_rev_8_21_14_0_65_46_12]PIR10793.1 MAG: acyl-CoA dehydrogenase [Gammaproteobacteria bacterium CG11_big_fil_rev_8_21_14_0_20_46_22]